MRSPLVLFLCLALLGCREAPRPQGTADSLTIAVQVLLNDAKRMGACSALSARISPEAVVLARVPIAAGTWRCDWPDSLGWLSRVEVASDSDFGYSVGAWEASDSSAWWIAVWRRPPEGVWMVEAAALTRHPRTSGVGGFKAYAGLGAIRATRQLYQEAARVSMLKSDRDLAVASTDVGLESALDVAMADSVLLLHAGRPPAVGRDSAQSSLRRLQGMGIVTWLPIGGRVARAGDLGYTYGIATLRPSAADSALTSSTYLRLWRSSDQGQWKLVLDAQGSGQ